MREGARTDFNRDMVIGIRQAGLGTYPGIVMHISVSRVQTK